MLSRDFPVPTEVGEGERRQTAGTEPLHVVLHVFALGELHLGGVEKRVAVLQGKVRVTLKGVVPCSFVRTLRESI